MVCRGDQDVHGPERLPVRTEVPLPSQVPRGPEELEGHEREERGAREDEEEDGADLGQRATDRTEALADLEKDLEWVEKHF